MARETRSKITKSSNKLINAVAAPAYDEMKYRARDALNTLTRAEEIRRDKPLMAHVKKHAREEMKSMAKVCAPKKR